MTVPPGTARGPQDPPSLRRVLRDVPTPVAVVCTADGRRPAGATVGSFVSVSLDPPLVAWFAMRPSSTLDAVRRSGCFAVNVLTEDQGDLAEAFARLSGDRFRGVSGRPGRSGNPHLDGALVVLDCDLEEVRRIGDHDIVLGRVTRAVSRRPDAEPLVFAGGGFRALAAGTVGRAEAAVPA